MRAAALVCALGAAGCGGPSFDVGTPFAVAHTAPSHGAEGIADDVEVRIGFNEPVSRDAAREHIALAAADEPVDATLQFREEDHVVALIPVRALPRGSLVTLVVGPDMESAARVDLDAELVVEFTTAP